MSKNFENVGVTGAQPCNYDVLLKSWGGGIKCVYKWGFVVVDRHVHHKCVMVVSIALTSLTCPHAQSFCLALSMQDTSGVGLWSSF